MKVVTLLPLNGHFEDFSMHIVAKNADSVQETAHGKGRQHQPSRGATLLGRMGCQADRNSAFGHLEGFMSDARNHVGWPDEK